MELLTPAGTSSQFRGSVRVRNQCQQEEHVKSRCRAKVITQVAKCSSWHGQPMQRVAVRLVGDPMLAQAAPVAEAKDLLRDSLHKLIVSEAQHGSSQGHVRNAPWAEVRYPSNGSCGNSLKQRTVADCQGGNSPGRDPKVLCAELRNLPKNLRRYRIPKRPVVPALDLRYRPQKAAQILLRELGNSWSRMRRYRRTQRHVHVKKGRKRPRRICNVLQASMI